MLNMAFVLLTEIFAYKVSNIVFKRRGVDNLDFLGESYYKSADSFHSADHCFQNPFIAFLSDILFCKWVFLDKKILCHDAELQLHWCLTEAADAEAVRLALLVSVLVAPGVIQKTNPSDT